MKEINLDKLPKAVKNRIAFLETSVEYWKKEANRENEKTKDSGISPLALSMAKTEQKAWDDAAKNIGYKSDKNEL
jgi:hypothetical protein